jgi:hypothetical protein
MVESSRRDRVGLGLIGLGPRWEQVYREPLLRLRNRLTIRLVHDSVEARARSVANDLEAEVVGSLQQVLKRRTLQGVLILDPAWYRAGALDLIAQSGKPAFLGEAVLESVFGLGGSSSSRISLIHDAPENAPLNDQFVPELGLRLTPATCRLRELIATKLGPVVQLKVSLERVADANKIASVIDWCCHIMGGSPIRFQIVSDTDPFTSRIEFTFPPVSAGSGAVERTASIVQTSDADSVLKFDVRCLHGSASLLSCTQIVWRTEAGVIEESLTNERTAIEILIDQFCRRALGGLNPIGRLSEYLRAVEFAKLVRNSLG